jgi:hypothetical protein
MARRHRKAKVQTGITRTMMEELRSGVGMMLDCFEDPAWVPGKSIFASLLVARGAWLAVRETLLAEAEPLTRPWGWWAFEGPKQPRIVVRTCVDAECRVRNPGMDHEPHAILESDAEYLERLGLLSPFELGLLEAQRLEKSERAAAWQRSIEEYEATKRAVYTIASVPGLRS